MTAYRFRVKLAADPTSLWRDIVVGEERTLDEFQTVINETMGLDQAHLWFFGPDEDYWSSEIQFQRPEEYVEAQDEQSFIDELFDQPDTYNAGETAIGEMTDLLALGEGDRICYLFDYGDEWRFYAILKEVLADQSGTSEPTVVKEKGEPVDQYSYGPGW